MQRIILSLDDDLLARVVDWQHDHRLPTRTEALRQMLGVAAEADRLGLIRQGELQVKSRAARSA